MRILFTGMKVGDHCDIFIAIDLEGCDGPGTKLTCKTSTCSSIFSKLQLFRVNKLFLKNLSMKVNRTGYSVIQHSVGEGEGD